MTDTVKIKTMHPLANFGFKLQALKGHSNAKFWTVFK